MLSVPITTNVVSSNPAHGKEKKQKTKQKTNKQSQII
jgi:hypothetical protein